MRIRTLGAAFVGMAVALAGLPRQAEAGEPPMLVVCYSGGTVKARDAKDAIEKMLRVLEKLGSWPANTFGSAFTSDAKECEKMMADKKPPFAIASPAFYLANKTDQHLVPLVQPKIKGSSTDTFRIMVRTGTFRSIDELKGKTVGGTPMEDPKFVQKIVFRGRADLAKTFVTKQTPQALKALRSLADGELDAVLVNEQQFRALGSLPLAAQITAIYTSEPVPLVGVVSDTTRSTDDERKRFTKALSSFCGHADGKQFCDLFGIDGFLPVDAGTYRAIETLWNAP